MRKLQLERLSMPNQGQVRNARVRCLHASVADLDAASVGDAREVALKLEHFELRLKLHTGECGPKKNRISVQSPNITLLVTWGRGQPRQDRGVKSSRFGSKGQQRFVSREAKRGRFRVQTSDPRKGCIQVHKLD
jgi:hypothetical protein